MSTLEPPNPLADDLAYVLANTGAIWEGLRGRRVFVTGGTGFFGRWLLETFSHANTSLGLEATMVVLSRNPAAFLRKAPHFAHHQAVRFVVGDVCDFSAEELSRQLGGDAPHAFDFIIHAATDTDAGVQAADPLRLIDTIVQGTRSVLDLALAVGSKRLLLTSSGAVYGRQPGDVTHVSESERGAPDCTAPTSAYGEGKRMAELLCACYQQRHGLETLVARCFAFVGPFLPLDAHFAIGNFIRDALRGGPLRISGDGSPYRSYLYAADLAVWLWTILFQGQPARAYNVGSAQAISILELAETVAGVLGPGADIEVAGRRQEGALPLRYVPSVARAESELGLKVGIPLAESIRKTGHWAAAHDPAVARDRSELTVGRGQAPP